MTATSTTTSPSVTVKTSYRVPAILVVIALAATALFVGARRDDDTIFTLATDTDLVRLPDIVVPAAATTVVAVLLVVLAAVAAVRARRGRPIPLWLGVVFAMLGVAGFLIWAGSGAKLPLTGLLVGTLSLSVPLIFGALSGVISERVGVVNVAIEGQFLAGAFTAAVVASVTGSVVLGLVAAMLAGMLVAAVLAFFAIRYIVNQVIVGVVLNVLVTGLTTFLFTQVLSPNAIELNSPPRLPTVAIPVLSQIPVIGPVFFRQTIIVYAMYVAVALVWWALFHTRWGLRVRAVGEHPQAADTVGIPVNRTRWRAVILGGLVAGIGGSYFTLGSVGSFNIQMTAGAGFIALAAVIFGKWDPLRATLAAVLFGFASQLQYVLSIIGSPVPSEFMLMLPYVVTIFAVAGLVGHVQGPAASGKPYVTA